MSLGVFKVQVFAVVISHSKYIKIGSNVIHFAFLLSSNLFMGIDKYVILLHLFVWYACIRVEQNISPILCNEA